MTFLQAIVMAVLQGLTELFPVSSLGHAVVLPHLFGWNIDQHGAQFLPFLVVLHIGTAAALLAYFWRDWIGLALALFGIGARDQQPGRRRQLGLIVVATIPAVILGFALEKFFRNLFGTPVVASVFLIVNGGLLFFGERLRRAGRSVRTIDGMRWRDAIYIGLWQSTALIPGISRSGATMVGGLLAGLHHEDSARFSFLIATPVIAGAAVLEVPKLLHAGSFGPVAWIAGAVAGVTAFLSVVFLMRYFKRHDFEALDPFAWYCWTFGAVSLALLLFVL